MARTCIILLGILLLASTTAFAGAVTGDITVESDAGVITTYGEGNNVNVESNVHSVDVREGASTGDITIRGQVDEVTTVGIGNNVNAVTNVGSVKVGGN